MPFPISTATHQACVVLRIFRVMRLFQIFQFVSIIIIIIIIIFFPGGQGILQVVA